MNGLMIHTPGSEDHVSRETLAAVPLPEQTKTYMPVPHVGLVDEVRRVFDPVMGAEPIVEAFGLAREGRHMFGTLTYDAGGDVQGLCVGFRNSYDKTLAVGVVVGASVFVCDNLMFDGELKVVRIHTSGVWNDLPRLLAEAADQAVPAYNRLEDHRNRMQSVELADDDAFGLLGVMRGQGVLAARTFERSVREWIEPSHEDFEDPNLWRLYNGCTEALKDSPPNDLVPRHNAVHRFLLDAAA